MKSQVEAYRAKAKEYARLTRATKSLRDSRQYRKLAEMYSGLALGEEPERVQESKMVGKISRDERAVPRLSGAPSLSCRQKGTLSNSPGPDFRYIELADQLNC